MLGKYGTHHPLTEKMKYKNILSLFAISLSDIRSLSGKVSVYHNNQTDGNYAVVGEKTVVVAKIPRSLTAFNVDLILIDAYKNEVVMEIRGKKKEYNLYFDHFVFEFESFGEPSLFFYYFKLNVGEILYGCRENNNSIAFLEKKPDELKLFQITVTRERSDGKEKIKGIMYHIFVDRFRRCGNITPRKNTVLLENWYSDIVEYPEYPGAYLRNNTFFGGNLYGIIEKLDYLKSLGVSLIYLSPIFESPSNHKYDTGNYEKIDDMLGGEESFSSLIEKAKELNIGIILDGVFNHTGADSKYFNKYKSYDSIGAYESKDSEYYDWYRFEKYPHKYECWWGIDILPRIFYESSGAENYFLGKGGIVERWMEYGIRGFRLDVADELSDSFIEKMRNIIKKYNEGALLYGEVWEDASNKVAYGVRKKYYLGNELTGVMNYPLRNGIISYITKKYEAELEYALNSVMMNMPKFMRDRAMNILGSHDSIRIISALSGTDHSNKTNKELSVLRMSEEEYKRAKRRLMSAYTVIATLPGIPTVYYGDEAGVEGYSDPFNRRTFPWGKEDKEILCHYKKTGKLRYNYSVLSDGDFYLLHLDKEILVFERKGKSERLITVYNNSNSAITVSFSESVTDLYNEIFEKSFNIDREFATVFKTNSESEIEIKLKY